MATSVARAFVIACGLAAQAAPERVDLVLDCGEAEAELAILERRRTGAEVADADWARLFGSDGYRRLVRRETAMGREKLENTLAHELHHIGYASCCPTKAAAAAIAKLPARAQSVHRWIGAFGEGFAMLAAAGGPDVHPHAVSPAAERARWDRDVARFDEDLEKLESFFLDVLEGRLADAREIEKRAMGFFRVQGPWYTVGWRMSVAIERGASRSRPGPTA